LNSESRNIVDKLENINRKICEMRQTLQDLIIERPSLLDPEVIFESQELDKALNEYNNLLNKVDK
jgi:stage 0 sporulation regulatory protein